MRTLVVTLFAVSLATASNVQAQQAKAQAREARAAQATEREAMIERLAQQIFTEADQSRNKLLNKREFADAQGLLKTAVDQWGRARIIGKPLRGQKTATKDQEAAMTAAAMEASTEGISKSNKITSAEFAFYVHAFVDQADRQWRQLNASAAAQAQAQAQERRQMKAARRAIKTGPGPIFLPPAGE